MDRLHDPFVARALELVPELVEQEEWSAHLRRRTEDGFEAEGLSLDSLGYFVLGPFLWRRLDQAEPSRDVVLKRLFALLEELLVSRDEGAVRTAKHKLDWRVFRHPRAHRAKPLLGPKSRAFVESLDRAFAPFRPAWEVMKPHYDNVLGAAKACYPSLGCCALYDLAGPRAFTAQLLFVYDGASQRWEDVIFDLSVRSAASYRTPQLAEAGSGEVAKFSIERGTGQELAVIAPRLLPADRNSVEYRDALVDFAHDAKQLIDQRMTAALQALSEPFIPWFVSAERNTSRTTAGHDHTTEGDRHWQDARARLEGGYREILAAMRARQGDTVGAIQDRSTPDGQRMLSVQVTSPSSPDPHAGLTLKFLCAPAQQFFEAEEKAPPVFPEHIGRDAAGFQILRGTRRGTVVGTIWPALLPDHERPADYRSALRKYVERAIEYAAEHVEMMHAALNPQSSGHSPPI